MADQTTNEDERLMRLQQSRQADETAGEEATGEEATGEEKAKEEHFINTGEAALLLAFTGAIEVICWILDFIPYLGWIINIVITVIVGGILLIWLTGKVAKGAPKKWYKAIYWGAVGGAIPIVPGYLGAIIWLLVQDRKILGKVAGKLGEAVEKTIEKVK